MTVLDRPTRTQFCFESERQRLLEAFSQRSSELARQVVESLGNLREYYAQFTRDQALALRVIVGDLTRSFAG